jgi:hypothetical protein
LQKAKYKNHVRPRDFIHDRTAADRPLKWLSVVGKYTQECLAFEVDRSITADTWLTCPRLERFPLPASREEEEDKSGSLFEFASPWRGWRSKHLLPYIGIGL